MEKGDMLKSLEEALKFVLGRELTGIDKISMESAIERFIVEEASRYSETELIEEFKTPEKSVNRFLRYLETIGAHETHGAGTVH